MKYNDTFIVARCPKELKSKLEKIADHFKINLSSAMRIIIEEKFEEIKI